MAAPLLEVRGLVKRFGGFTALNGVSLSVKQGERFGLIGPNGSGKTTLINCVSGVLPVNGGTIHFDGREITGLPPHQRSRGHRPVPPLPRGNPDLAPRSTAPPGCGAVRARLQEHRHYCMTVGLC